MSGEPAGGPKWVGFLAGTGAASLMGVVMLLLRLEKGIRAYPEIIGNALSAHVPIGLFNFSTRTFGEETKPIFFVVLTTIMVGVGGLFGVLYVARLYRPAPFWCGALIPALGIGGMIWLAIIFGLSPLVGVGIGGKALPGGVVRYTLAGLILCAIYAVTLASMTTIVARSLVQATDRPAVKRGRREFLRGITIGTTLVSLGCLAVLVRRFVSPTTLHDSLAQPTAAVLQAEAIARVGRTQAGFSADPAFTAIAGKLPAEVTDADHFYIISKNFGDPTIALNNWLIAIDGLVARPYTLTYDDLIGLPSVTFLRTMECISNRVGGDLISNGQWTGVPLRVLLDRAAVRAGAIKVRFESDDGYMTAIPLTEAMESETVLVYHLNGSPLPQRHGFPARLIFPNHYGMKNPKWITRITLVAEDYLGFWEQQGWSDHAVVETMARIDTPLSKEAPRAGVPATIGGIAYAGNRGISRVEVSTDGGRTWLQAALQPPLSPLTWVFWAQMWTPPAPGTYTLLARAVDGTGALQTAVPRQPIPDGATGYHNVSLSVQG